MFVKDSTLPADILTDINDYCWNAINNSLQHARIL